MKFHLKMPPLSFVLQLLHHSSKLFQRHFRQLIIVNNSPSIRRLIPNNITARGLGATIPINAVLKLDPRQTLRNQLSRRRSLVRQHSEQNERISIWLFLIFNVYKLLQDLEG